MRKCGVNGRRKQGCKGYSIYSNSNPLVRVGAGFRLVWVVAGWRFHKKMEDCWGTEHGVRVVDRFEGNGEVLRREGLIRGQRHEA